MIDLSNCTHDILAQLIKNKIIEKKSSKILGELIEYTDLTDNFLNDFYTPINQYIEKNSVTQSNIEFDLIKNRYSFLSKNSKEYKEALKNELILKRQHLIDLSPDIIFINENEFKSYLKSYISVEDILLFNNNEFIPQCSEKYKGLIIERIEILSNNKLISKLNKEIHKTGERTFPQFSLRWGKSEEKLRFLYETLNNLYLEDTNFESFKKIFNNIEISDNFKPIIWKSSQVELVYFICEFCNNQIIKSEKRDNKYITPHKTIALCFRGKNGKKYDSNSLNASLGKIGTFKRADFWSTLIEDLKS